MKIRNKASDVYEFFNFLTLNALEYLQSISHFKLLSTVNKQILLLRQSHLVIMYYTHYQMNLEPVRRLRETPCWISSFDCLLLHSTHELIDQIIDELDLLYSFDSHLIQLILLILTFNIDSADESSPTFDRFHYRSIFFEIQSFYVDLMWKYMA